MILTLFLALMALAVVVCLLGYFTGDEPYLTMGLFFLFLLSIVILTNNLEYETGANITTSSVGNTTTTNISYTFTAWNDNTSQKIGWGLAVISLIGTALSLHNTSARRRNTNG